jgi:rubrerythrin
MGAESPVKDRNYNLIAVLQESLQNVFQLETYAQDAEQDGDQELASWFRAIQENNRKAGEQGKELLSKRLDK